VAERMNFKAFLCFIIMWPVLIYYTIAHWVWNGEGWLAEMGAKDFAGGITIHTSAGIAGFTVSIFLVRRRGFKVRGERRTKIRSLKLVGPLKLLGYIFRKEESWRG